MTLTVNYLGLHPRLLPIPTSLLPTTGSPKRTKTWKCRGPSASSSCSHRLVTPLQINFWLIPFLLLLETIPGDALSNQSDGKPKRQSDVKINGCNLKDAYNRGVTGCDMARSLGIFSAIFQRTLSRQFVNIQKKTYTSH